MILHRSNPFGSCARSITGQRLVKQRGAKYKEMMVLDDFLVRNMIADRLAYWEGGGANDIIFTGP